MLTEQTKENRVQFLLSNLNQRQLFVIEALTNNKIQNIEFIDEIQKFIEIMAQTADFQKNNIEAIESGQKTSQKVKILQILQRDALRQGIIKLRDHQTIQQVKDFLINHVNKSNQETDAFLKRHSPWIYQKKRTQIIRLLISKFKRKLSELKDNALPMDHLKKFMGKLVNIICERVLRSTTNHSLEIIYAQKVKFGMLVCSEITEQQLYGLDTLDKNFRLRVLKQTIETAVVLQLKIEKFSIKSIKQPNTIEIVKSIVLWFPKIQKLGLAGCQLGIEAILVVKQLLFLERLNLSGNHIDNQGVRQLSKAEFRYLEKLSLCSNPISNKGLYYLAKSDWPQLRYMYLYQCNSTQDGLKSISKFTILFQKVSLGYFHGFTSQRNHSLKSLYGYIRKYGEEEDTYDL